MHGRYWITKNTTFSLEYKRMRSSKTVYREKKYYKYIPHKERCWKRFRKMQYK